MSKDKTPAPLRRREDPPRVGGSYRLDAPAPARKPKPAKAHDVRKAPDKK